MYMTDLGEGMKINKDPGGGSGYSSDPSGGGFSFDLLSGGYTFDPGKGI